MTLIGITKRFEWFAVGTILTWGLLLVHFGLVLFEHLVHYVITVTLVLPTVGAGVTAVLLVGLAVCLVGLVVGFVGLVVLVAVLIAVLLVTVIISV